MHPFWLADQHAQEIKFLGGEVDRFVTSAHLITGNVKTEISNFQDLGLSWRRQGPTKPSPDSSEQFLKRERFGEVVIRPGIESFHPLLDIIMGGEHQHRRGVQGLTQTAAEFHPAEIGQAPVQQDQVERLGAEVRQGLRNTGSLLTGVALDHQLLHQKVPQIGIVIHHKKTTACAVARHGGQDLALAGGPRLHYTNSFTEPGAAAKPVGTTRRDGAPLRGANGRSALAGQHWCAEASDPVFSALSLRRATTLSGRMARWGLLIVAAYGLVALLTPLLIHAGLLPDANAGLENPIYAPPSWGHWCGTDRLGRDVCVRTLAGSGVALQVVLIALIAALAVGVPLGMVSGYLGGWLDRTLVLLMDTLYTLPVLLLSVVLAFLLGKGLPNAAAALCVVYVPQYFRVVRNQTAQVKAELFVEAARSLGAGPLWVLRRYLLRNVITSVPVLLTLNAADAVLVLGGLGFLGLGLPETVPEWGSDLQQALTAVPTGIWWTALFPGVAMFVLVLGLSFLGEGLESWLSGSGTVGRAQN
jgi:peptide/nickel transport system permease protein